MEVNQIRDALRRTVDPAQIQEANAYLDSVRKIIGFAPTLLQVVMSEETEIAVRQAGVIYFKNMVTRFWDNTGNEDEAAAFSIHEQDRHQIREVIVNAITIAPEPIRVQLTAAVSAIVKADFPGRWPGVVDKISEGLDTADGKAWMGSLLTLYRLVKVFEYKKAAERLPLTEAMKVQLPVLFERMQTLMPDQSAEAVFLQKLILKIMYALVQFSLNFKMLTMESFAKWILIFKEVVDRDVPAEVLKESLSVEEEERSELIWWKAKKWAMHLLARISERYGTPGQVQPPYKPFADLYAKDLAAPCIETTLKVLDRKRVGEWVSSRVLNQALCYLQNATSQASAWSLIKPHFDQMVQEVVFPLMCYSDHDEAMWEDDPREYIKAKLDLLEELVSPEASAGSFLSAAMKRKGQLAKTVQFIVQVLNSAEATTRHIDGALHMTGVLAPNLLKKKVYKKELEGMLLHQVCPRAAADSHKILRARAMHCIQMLSEAPLSTAGLQQIVNTVLRCLLEDTELPVKTEAAISMQLLLADQTQAEAMFEPAIPRIVPALMHLLKEVESDDLTTVMDRVLNTYPNQIIPIAVETAQNLAALFKEIVSTDAGMEDRSVAAMGILGTLMSVSAIMEDHKEIMLSIEGIILEVIKVVFEGTLMDFYEEVLSLIESLTTTTVSAPLWEVYTACYNMFKLEGMDFFADMMPCLHNFLTVDTEAFLSDPQRVHMMLEMCQQMLTTNESTWGEDSECQAGKLLECVVLECAGRIPHLLPDILRLALQRLARPIDTSELRTMMLQILVAGLHTDPVLTLTTLRSTGADPGLQVLNKFLAQWLADTDCFFGIHDRKLSIIGLCEMLALSPDVRPEAISGELSTKILKSLIVLFDGLEKAYKAEAELNNLESGSSSSEEEEGAAEDGLASDEDEEDHQAMEYMARLNRKGNDGEEGDDAESWSESDNDDDDWDENELEVYDTPLDRDGAPDEYIIFKETLAHVGGVEPGLFAALKSELSGEEEKELRRILQLAEQRTAAKASKDIETKGGYDFSRNNAIPTDFNFSQ